MTLNLSALEREYLLELLNQSFLETMREENRTDTLDYRASLRQKIHLIDNLRDRINNLITADPEDADPEIIARAASNHGIF